MNMYLFFEDLIFGLSLDGLDLFLLSLFLQNFLKFLAFDHHLLVFFTVLVLSWAKGEIDLFRLLSDLLLHHIRLQILNMSIEPSLSRFEADLETWWFALTRRCISSSHRNFLLLGLFSFSWSFVKISCSSLPISLFFWHHLHLMFLNNTLKFVMSCFHHCADIVSAPLALNYYLILLFFWNITMVCSWLV